MSEVLSDHYPEAVSKVPSPVHQSGPETGVTQAYSMTQVKSVELKVYAAVNEVLPIYP